jgi:hypothetical protein
LPVDISAVAFAIAVGHDFRVWLDFHVLMAKPRAAVRARPVFAIVSYQGASVGPSV